MFTFNLRNVKIKSRMYGLVILFVFFLLALGVVGLMFIKGIRQNVIDMYDHPFRITNAIENINTGIHHIQKMVHDYRSNNAEFERVRIREDLMFMIGKIEDDFSIIKESYLGEPRDYQRTQREYQLWINSILSSLQKVDTCEDCDTYKIFQEKEVLLIPLFRGLEEISNYSSRKAEEFYSDSNERLRNYHLSFLLILLVVLIFFFLTARRIVSSIINPVKDLNEFAESVINGQLTINKPDSIRDEIDELAYSFSEMTKKLIEANRDLEIKVEERTQQLQEEVKKYQDVAKKLMENENIFGSMFDAELFGAIFWEKDGTIVKANDKYLEMLGYTREEYNEKGLNWLDYTLKDDLEKDRQRLSDISERGIKPFRKKYYHKDGSIIDVLISAAAIQDSPFLGIAFVIDVTEQVANEDKISKYNEDLEGIIKERTRKLESNIAMVDESRKALTYLLEDVNSSRTELERVNNQLDSVNKELEAFSYSVSHDLKAPLRAIDGFSLALYEDYFDKLGEEGKEFIELIRSNASKMGQLISDLLSFSRTGRKAINYETVSIKEISNEVFDELTTNLNISNVNLIIEGDCDIKADRSMIKQVFINLLSNGIKFTRDKSNPQLTIGYNKHEKDIEIYVKDNGIGFDMKYIDKLFGVFQRLHSDEDYEGTGVGLALVKRIITKHQGSIRAEGIPNEGASFFITLPLPDEESKNGNSKTEQEGKDE